VQRVVKAQDRESIRELPKIVAEVKRELLPIEEQWGIQIHEFGFSTFSPTPETLEITQHRKLAEEKLGLFRQLREAGLGTEAAVALISGSVVALRPVEHEEHRSLPAPIPAEQVTPPQKDEIEQMLADEDEDTPTTQPAR
jgi:hypothetical protein